MLYLYINDNQIKILYLKRTLLGQYETGFFAKTHDTDLLQKGKVHNVDVLASAIKEGLGELNSPSEKQVFLVLPQESFSFFKTEVPQEIASQAIEAFVRDKAKTKFPTETETFYYDYFVKETDNKKMVNFFTIDNNALDGFVEVVNLLGLKLVSILPESLAFFKLFEKTLRAEKKENIFFVTGSKEGLLGYLYDSAGLIQTEKFTKKLEKGERLVDVLKEKKERLEEKDVKLQRIILSGEQSEGIRQDTFTKNVGVWTNPLKRIIPNFYEDYLKMLVVPMNGTFPLLKYDVCFGAFVFSQDNKDFQILKKQLGPKTKASWSVSRFPLFRKEFLIFIVSAIVSFLIFIGISRMNVDFNKFKLPSLVQNKPAPTETPKSAVPSPTPTPAVKKEEVKIKILNGSGTVGVASDVKDILTKKGYQEILTGNADNYDYTQTLIQVKKGQTALANLIKKDLADSIENPKVEETLKENAASDVEITVGTDFK